MKYYRTNYILKISITNMTSSNVGFVFKLMPKENTNLYLPGAEFNYNVKERKKDLPIMYLMKKNPEEPFGDFFLSTLFNELGDQDNKYATNTLEFEEDGSHCTYEFKTS